VKYILEEIKKNKTITMEDLLVKVKEKYISFDVSRRHLVRVIKDNNITLKITRVRHEPTKRFGKEIDINQKIKEFYEEVKKYKLEDIMRNYLSRTNRSCNFPSQATENWSSPSLRSGEALNLSTGLDKPVNQNLHAL
jgi:hypothetical protein